MKEYRLFQDDKGKWFMEEYENNSLIIAVMGNSKADCLDQLFHDDIFDLNFRFAESCGVIFP